MKKQCYIPKKNFVIDKVKEQKIIEITQEDYNRHCFDCGSLNPQYISLYNAIFICKRCVNNLHRMFNSNISLILNNDLYKLSIKDIQYLYYGGNRKLFNFINYEYPILQSLSRNRLYITKGIDYYRRYLRYLIDDEEKPVKPSMEESCQLIFEVNRNKAYKKNIHRKKKNLININYLNNYDNNNYNYNNNYEYEDKRAIIKSIYDNNYKTNLSHSLTKQYNYNKLNQKRNYYSSDKENDLSEFSLMNNYNIDYYNNRNIFTERDNNDYLKNRDYYDLNQKIKEIKILNAKINNNIINSKKLITKRLNLKSKKIFKGKIKNLSMNRNNNDKNTKNAKNEYLESNNIIYTKPTHTLFSSFTKNAPKRNREEKEIEKEDSPILQRSYMIPHGNNYQSILINNNNYDDVLMYNYTDRTNNTINTIKINNAQFIRPGHKYSNYTNSFDNSNKYTNNTEPYKDMIFKKKNLKNSFSIDRRKIKKKMNNININKNQSVIENINFQIIPVHNSDNTKKGHIKLVSAINNNVNDTYSIDSEKNNEIIKEIKVKKKQKIILENNKMNNLSSENSTVKNFDINDNTSNNDKNLSSLKDNISSAKKETNLNKLINLTKIMKNDMKLSIPKLTLTNFNKKKKKKHKLNKSVKDNQKETFNKNCNDNTMNIRILSKTVKVPIRRNNNNNDDKPYGTLRDIFKLKPK